MTPEERAKDWFTIAPKHRTAERLAEFIRAAENEALEQAAVELGEAVAVDGEDAAAIVRLLKHGNQRSVG